MFPSCCKYEIKLGPSKLGLRAWYDYGPSKLHSHINPTILQSEEPVESTAVKVQQPAEAQPVPDDAAVPADRPAAEQSSMSTGSNGNGTAAGSGASGNTGRGNKRKKNRGGKGKKGGAH